MELSKHLINEFVKSITKTEKDIPKTDLTHYGTSKIVDGKTYVQFDGAQTLTPAITTTADVSDNERVTVIIKDHTALITGNITSPSGSIDDIEQGVTSSLSYTDSKLIEYATNNRLEEYYKEQTNTMTTMSNNLKNAIENLTEAINNSEQEYNIKIDDLSKYIRSDGSTVTIGPQGNQLTLSVAGNSILFEKNGVAQGYWDGENFHTGNIVVDLSERAQFGNFAFVPRSDGSLMFLKVKS